jgi:ketosteroid isomerase-like protein
MSRDETLAFLRRYLDAVEAGATGEALAQFYDPAVKFTEHPNRLVPKGVTRDLAGILAAAEAGKAILASQTATIHESIVEGDKAALTMAWRGVFAVDVERYAIKAGGEMLAQFAQVYRFKDGRIIEQQTFDCIAPW